VVIDGHPCHAFLTILSADIYSRWVDRTSFPLIRATHTPCPAPFYTLCIAHYRDYSSHHRFCLVPVHSLLRAKTYTVINTFPSRRSNDNAVSMLEGPSLFDSLQRCRIGQAGRLLRVDVRAFRDIPSLYAYLSGSWRNIPPLLGQTSARG
jgi:hypothetical protein